MWLTILFNLDIAVDYITWSLQTHIPCILNRYRVTKKEKNFDVAVSVSGLVIHSTRGKSGLVIQPNPKNIRFDHSIFITVNYLINIYDNLWPIKWFDLIDLSYSTQIRENQVLGFNLMKLNPEEIRLFNLLLFPVLLNSTGAGININLFN